jgi:hypothetical protein
MTSPFLPGTNIQFAWDSTSLGWFKTCPRLYQYSMIEQWRSRGESVHLKFGQLYHTGLEMFDKLCATGYDHDGALNKVVHQLLIDTWEPATDTKPAGPWVSDHPNKTRETLIRSVIWYVDHFKDDPAQTVILANGKPAVELSFKMELDWGPKDYQYAKLIADGKTPTSIELSQPYVLCGHLDRVVNFSGGSYVMDRKTTTSTIGSNYFDQYDPDNQMSLYTLAAKIIYETPVKGVIIDGVQIAVGFSRFSRGFTYRTDAQIDEWLIDCKSWFALAKQYATAGHWPMNDKACHYYGGCAFRRVCSKSPEVRQKFLEADFVKKEWNPLIPR